LLLALGVPPQAGRSTSPRADNGFLKTSFAQEGSQKLDAQPPCVAELFLLEMHASKGPLCRFARSAFAAISPPMSPNASYWAGRTSPSLDEFEVLARQAFERLPDAFRSLVGELTFTVADFADEEVLDELELDSPFDLMGLFHGVGLAHASAVPPTGAMPNRIWLYRRAILDYWAEHDETLDAIVTHVLIHEIGHHFGLSDDDIDAIEVAAE
jgi:predicted Zn-dependent protease with MMP-like domain